MRRDSCINNCTSYFQGRSRPLHIPEAYLLNGRGFSNCCMNRPSLGSRLSLSLSFYFLAMVTQVNCNGCIRTKFLDGGIGWACLTCSTWCDWATRLSCQLNMRGTKHSHLITIFFAFFFLIAMKKKHKRRSAGKRCNLKRHHIYWILPRAVGLQCEGVLTPRSCQPNCKAAYIRNKKR